MSYRPSLSLLSISLYLLSFFFALLFRLTLRTKFIICSNFKEINIMNDNINNFFLEMARLGWELQHLGPLLVRTLMCANNCFSFIITINTHLYLFNMYRRRTLNRDRPSFAAIFVFITFCARFTAAPARPWENIYYDSVLRNPAVKVKKMRFKQVSTAKLFQTYNFLPFLLFPNIPSLKGPFFTPKQFS